MGNKANPSSSMQRNQQVEVQVEEDVVEGKKTRAEQGRLDRRDLDSGTNLNRQLFKWLRMFWRMR